jgi:membrane associated rhomboid family serine protease
MPAARHAPLTSAIVIVTALAWLVALAGAPPQWLAEQGGFIPLRLSGATNGFFVPAVLTPFTAALIHGGVFHLGMNMLLLVICGRGVETVIGSGALGVLYGAGAIAAAAGQFFADPGSPVPMIGASGAISAVLAVYAMLFGRNEVKAIGPIPSHWVRALWLAAGWIGVQLLIGLATIDGEFQVAIAAHIGGFLMGLALARPLLAWRYRGA